MIEGFFKRRVSDSIICFICGLFVCSLFIFIEFEGNELFGIAIGIAICVYSIISFLFNHKAFIRIDEDSIKAKYHWFGKINCKFSDVDFALARINTLIIRLKNGKCHTIMGIENSWELCSVIRQNMRFNNQEQAKMLIKKLDILKSAKKRGIVYVCLGLALMFIIIFVTVFLTGGKDFAEFSKADWLIMAIMGIIELAIIIATFYFAYKTGKNNVPIEKLHYCIKRTIIETTPLSPGNAIGVFTDENYMGRITLYGFPNEDSVYYTTQELTAEYELVRTYHSEIFENMQQLSEDLKAFIDITGKFQN